MNTLSISSRPVGLSGQFGAWTPKRLVTMFSVMGERRRLRDLDKDALADLGLTPEEAAREAGRPFWDLPAGR